MVGSKPPAPVGQRAAGQSRQAGPCSLASPTVLPRMPDPPRPFTAGAEPSKCTDHLLPLPSGGFLQPTCLGTLGTCGVFHCPGNLPPCSVGWWKIPKGELFQARDGGRLVGQVSSENSPSHLAETPVHRGHGGPCCCPSPTHLIAAPLLLCSGCPTLALNG